MKCQLVQVEAVRTPVHGAGAGTGGLADAGRRATAVKFVSSNRRRGRGPGVAKVRVMRRRSSCHTVVGTHRPWCSRRAGPVRPRRSPGGRTADADHGQRSEDGVGRSSLSGAYEALPAWARRTLRAHAQPEEPVFPPARPLGGPRDGSLVQVPTAHRGAARCGSTRSRTVASPRRRGSVRLKGRQGESTRDAEGGSTSARWPMAGRRERNRGEKRSRVLRPMS